MFGRGCRSSILKLWMDNWTAGFSGSCCPGLSPVIGSAWLINGGHCRWTPFSTDRHYLSQHFISPFPQMDHISLSIEAYTDKIKILLYPSLCCSLLKIQPYIVCGCFLFMVCYWHREKYIHHPGDRQFQTFHSLTASKNKTEVIND